MHLILWKYSKLNLLLKLRATKSRDRQAEPSSRHHRLTGRVWANIREDPDQLYGVLSRNWLVHMLLNIMVNICYRPSNLQNILFVDNPNIRGYCFTKKISPLKTRITKSLTTLANEFGVNRDFLEKEKSHCYLWEASHKSAFDKIH